MVKQNHKSQTHRPEDITRSERMHISVLRGEPELWYRLRVLLYDLSNVAKDPSSENRIGSTTNELYISEPYFTDSEAIRIRTAIVDGILDNTDAVIHVATNVAAEAEGEDMISASDSSGISTFSKDATVEEMIHTRLSKFFEKRKASGDARPCGPHDMLPIYLNVFRVGKEELKDDQFLSRLRRSGLVDCRPGECSRAEGQSIKLGRGKGKEKHDR